MSSTKQKQKQTSGITCVKQTFPHIKSNLKMCKVLCFKPFLELPWKWKRNFNFFSSFNKKFKILQQKIKFISHSLKNKSSREIFWPSWNDLGIDETRTNVEKKKLYNFVNSNVLNYTLSYNLLDKSFLFS